MVTPRVVRDDASGADLLVRGDRISFVSVEQADRTGIHPLDDKAMPSDIVLPEDFVLVQDPKGKFFGRCDFYIVQWHNERPVGAKLDTKVAKVALDYFGDDAKLIHGSVDIPEEKWQRVTQIAFIRYRRAGELKGNYEHPYNPSVWLHQTPESKMMAWRVALPTGCVVDGRGFVWP